MAYSIYGPFTDGSSPGISASFLNTLETFLSGLSAISYDTHVTSDGNGNTTVVKINLTTGSVKRIARATGSATQTITHNWGEQADIVLPYYNGSFGTAPTQALAVKSEGTNSFTVVGQSGYSWTVLYIKF